ncbi:MAG: hypothetical protein WCS34_07915 [Bacteroidales bacterium]
MTRIKNADNWSISIGIMFPRKGMKSNVNFEESINAFTDQTPDIEITMVCSNRAK